MASQARTHALIISPTKPGGLPKPPVKPADFTAGNFPAVTHDESVNQAVIGVTMPVAASLTAAVTQTGAAVFHVTGIAVDNLVLETLQASQLPPSLKGLAGQQVWQQTPAGSSDGVTPIAVAAGQLVYLNVAVDVPDGAVPPGPLAATATLSGGAGFTRTVALTGTYLGVNTSSPIGQKWAAMGGEAKLGAVKSNEEPAPDGNGTIQEFANGVLWAYEERVRYSIKPITVVYFLSAAVWAKWMSLSGAKDASGVTPVWIALGYPTADTGPTAEGGQAQKFQNGEIVVRASGPAWVVYGAIFPKYLEFGDPANAAQKPAQGYPTSDELPAGGPANAPWRVSHFDSADVYWSNATGAHEIHGVMRDHWLLNMGLGFPISDETVTPNGLGSFNRLQGGMIYRTTGGPAFVVYGAILDRWSALGYEASYLGFPVSDEEDWTAPAPYGPGRISFFQWGQIGWRRSDGTIFELPATTPAESAQVVTPSGTALGGTVTMLLKSNGDYIFECHMHDSGLASYDFSVRAIFTTPLGLVIAAEHAGHVEGTDATTFTHAPNRDDDHTEADNNPLIRANWASGDIAGGTLWVTKDYSATGVIGFVQDVTKAILDITAAVAGFTIGTVISVGREIGQIFGNLGVGMIVGVFAGVAICVYTGGYVFAVVPGIVAGAVTDAMIQQRQITDDEYNFCNFVFQGSLPPASNIQLTNLNLVSGRAFTVPGVDGQYYINLGSAYGDDPLDYFGNSSYQGRGELLVHEMTHVWQMKHQDITSVLICDAIVTQTNYQAGQDVYQYGAPGASWGSFGLEGQGAIVDQWFGGVRVVNAPARTLNWMIGPDGKPADSKGLGAADPYFGYIANNIRKGQT